MCGIAGMLSFDGAPVTQAELAAMCAALVHRGPDDEGLYVTPGVGLGARRLSIIDLVTGHQPVRNEDGSVWVVLNGEIYNFRALRRELQNRGHAFRTATDTETIVHLYEEDGIECVHRLRGMFAFALWDERARRLVLARDRLGIKPLYYTTAAGRLLFASELKALLQLPEIERRLNWRAVSHLFATRYPPAAESIIEGVRKLPPGHRLQVGPQDALRVEPYWDVTFTPDRSRTEGEYADQLRSMLEESVRLHLESDVPLGAFLSGGIDSSSVVATMARLVPGRVKTFSIGFSVPEYDEIPYARLVAQRFGTEHHELVLQPDALGVLDDLIWYLDEPFGDPSAIPTYMVSQIAARHVTVALSGDGGDELFAGYDKYVVEARERRYPLPGPVRSGLRLVARMLPDGMRGRNLARHFSLPAIERYLDAATVFGVEEQARLFCPEFFRLPGRPEPWQSAARVLAGANGGWLSALQDLDLRTYLPLDILTKVDRMSMAHSLEARVPLLDHKFVEFAATIPDEFKFQNGRTKHIFKRAMQGILPDAVLERPKQGFGVPLARWFRGELNTFLRELLLSDRLRQRGIFHMPAIERVLVQHERGRRRDDQLWTLLAFELWCRAFLDRPARPPVLPEPRRASLAAGTGT